VNQIIHYLEDWQLYWPLHIFAIVFILLLANFLVSRLCIKTIVRLDKTSNIWDDALIKSIRLPLQIAIWTFGIIYTIDLISTSAQYNIGDNLVNFRRLCFIVLTIWSLIQFFNIVQHRLISSAYLKHPWDKTSARIVTKLLQISTIITGFLVILQTYGFSISGVLAFGGIGGIVIGFAAKDLLSNFFGALVIFIDKPFAIGDWIRSSEQDIEGTVEDIGWRSTKIRTFSKRLLYVPNAVFNQISIENPSKMTHRRIELNVGVRYCDLAKVKSIVQKIEQMFADEQFIDQNQTTIVNLNNFNNSSIDIYINAYATITNWQKHHQYKQSILFKIAAIIDNEGAEIAFPTQTLHIENDLKSPMP